MKKITFGNEFKLFIYILLRIIVIITLIRQFFLGNWDNVLICILTLLLFNIPSFLERRTKIHFPNFFEIVIVLFIFSAEILGEINNFYGSIVYWDAILHTINGFLFAAIGFSLVDILNRSDSCHFHLSPFFVALVALCFSMTVGVLWEFFEFFGDQILHTDMQKDSLINYISSISLEPNEKNMPIFIDNINYTQIFYESKDGILTSKIINNGYLDIGLIDTMQDLIVNFIGALVFSIIGTMHIKNRDHYKFVDKIVPTFKK